MALLKVELISNKPTLFDSDRRYIALGRLKAGGDIFIPFMSVESGKIYVEEAFASSINGQFLTGLKQVEDDKVWGALIRAAQEYKLIAPRHIADSLRDCGVKVPLHIAQLIATNKPDLDYMKGLGVIT